MTTPTGDAAIPPLSTTIPPIEERLVRDELTNEVHLPLPSTVVLKRKQGMLYVPLDFANNLTVDVLVDSRAFVRAIAQNDLVTIKEKAPNNILKTDDRPKFQIQVANGQSGKPLATATLKFEIGDNTFAEHFVLKKKLTEPITGLYVITCCILTSKWLTLLVQSTLQLTFSPDLSVKSRRGYVSNNTYRGDHFFLGCR